MAKLVFALNQSLDGYVDHTKFRPTPGLFRHYIGLLRGQTGELYGRRLYGVMRYWDKDQEGWGAPEKEYAAVWRSKPKWVVSRTMKSVGPNATLISKDVEVAVRKLKAKMSGEIGVGGTVLAHGLGKAGLIDEYRLYVCPVVIGRGKPFFAGPRPPLRLKAVDRITKDVVRLTYVPA